ncbi:MAG: ComEA family DNA-binding protein, partial [Micromonosporaceae bacterium]
FRTANGGFGSIEELDAVPGIGPARLEQLRPLVDL